MEAQTLNTVKNWFDKHDSKTIANQIALTIKEMRTGGNALLGTKEFTQSEMLEIDSIYKSFRGEEKDFSNYVRFMEIIGYDDITANVAHSDCHGL